MNKPLLVLILVIGILLNACASTVEDPATQIQQAGVTRDCTATAPDMLGPFYTPGAPERSRVGSGYLLSGQVFSLEDCLPVPGAMIELWMAGPDGEYADSYRATIIAGADGDYQFETHVPVPYAGRPPHIHVKVSAPGFVDLITQYYPGQGEVAAKFDLVLTPIKD